MAEMLRNPDTTVAASPHYFRTLVLAMIALSLAAGLLWGASREADLEKQMEAAIHREVVMGDLAGAIEQYRGILSTADVPRPIAAHALLRTGECQEKLGRGIESNNTYRKVVNEYRDQAEVVKLASEKLAAWVGPRNLKFEEGVRSGWFVPSLPKDAAYVAELRHDQCRTSACAVVVAPVNVPGQPGNLTQSFEAGPYRGKTVRLRAWLKLEQIFEMTSGILRLPDKDDRGQLWLRVVRPKRLVGFSDSTEDRPVRTSTWTMAEIKGQVEEDAQMINFGVMSFGGAQVWIDDVSFEVVEK